MALSVNDTLQNNSPKPLDNKYGIFASGAFRAFTNIAEATTTVLSAYRSIGLTQLINNGSTNVEYWYKDGIADINLVPKLSTATSSSPITLTGGVIGIQVANTSQGGYLSNTDWNAFNTKLTGVASVGSGIALYASTSGGTANIKSIIAGTGMTFSDNGTAITINSSSSSVSNLGAGSGVYSGTVGGVLQLRSVLTTGSLSSVQNTNDITLAIAGNTVPTPLTTTNTTPGILNTTVIENTSAGMLIVTVIGVTSGTSTVYSMAQRYAKYFKSAGVLTIVETGDIVSESLGTLSTASWAIVVNGSNNLDIQVTGETSTTVKWSATVQKYFNL